MAKLWFGYIGGVIIGTILMIRVVQAQDVVMIDNFEFADQSGNTYELAAVADQQAVVVIFTSSNCVFATQYEARINTLQDTYAEKGVSFVAVNSNDPALSQRDDEQVLRQTLPFSFPYLMDHDQSIANSFGAKSNPEVFVLVPQDSQFKVVYRGMIDDNPLNGDLANAHYLKDNLDALLAGEALPHSSNEVSGCEISWQ